jgi:hypothetical protein
VRNTEASTGSTEASMGNTESSMGNDSRLTKCEVNDSDPRKKIDLLLTDFYFYKLQNLSRITF